jgi:acetylglutamate kinase
VVKFGGELLEERVRLERVVSAIAAATAGGTPLAIVHGGGKEIDAALKTAGIPKQQADGLRVTDQPTLDVVVAVLAGTVNTRFVARLVSAGVRAVGLTGADAGCGLSVPAAPHRTVDGRTVDLGFVGEPCDDADVNVVSTLINGRFVPVIATLGIARNGQLLNVNADTFAAHLATRLAASRLVIAGTTAGVLADDGTTIREIDEKGIHDLVARGTATAGMIAKLRACAHALGHGAGDVVIVDGRDVTALKHTLRGGVADSATRLVFTRSGEPAGASPRQI